MTALAGVLAPRMPSPREATLWTAAAIVAALAHASVGYGIHGVLQSNPPAASEPALVIDITPLTVSTPEAIQSETAALEKPREVIQPVETAEIARNALDPETIEADMTEVAEPRPVETVTPAPVEQATAIAPEPVAEAVEPEKADVTEATPVEPELTAPEVAAVMPEVVAALPEPRPVVVPEPEKTVVKARPEKADPRQIEKPRKTGAKKPDAKQKVVKAEAAPAPKSAVSVESSASKAKAVTPAKWQSKVVAWLNRHKRYPRGAGGEQGMVNVAFAIDASGSVLSVRVARSSGNAELDKAALDMVRRASPVPAPPPEIAESRMNLAVPVQFSLR